MRTYIHTVAGDETRIHYPERPADLAGFRDFLSRGDAMLAVDTETTGLDTYSPGHRVRLVQIGNRDEAWVLNAGRYADEIRAALLTSRPFVAHNAPFDMLELDRHLGVPLEALAPRMHDTRVMAHLLDSRREHEGGVGLSLKPLSSHYVDPAAEDTQKGLHEVFRGLGLTTATGWAQVPLDNETYVRYAGLDVIYTRRLYDALAPEVTSRRLDGLLRFELHLQGLVAMMQRRGVLLDVDYTTRLSERLDREAAEHRAAAARYGVTSVNATRQVADALVGMGETLTERTASGALKVDKSVLMGLADVDGEWNPRGTRDGNPLALAVLHAKRADKWRSSYAEPFLAMRDSGDRIHPSIGTMQARTARWSVSRPPLQQLPSGDWTIRRALIADPGHTIIAADFSQVEMRVLAALCGDRTLQQAIIDGADLHDFTAEMVFGPEFTKRERKIAKAIGFGKVYGGGAGTIQRQTGAPMEEVKRALAAYDRTYPGIKRYGRRLQERAEFGRYRVVTPSGRSLPLDRDRLYAATNYCVQSTARDIFSQAIVDLHEAGLGDLLLLPVHDEVVAQAPASDAAEAVAEIARIMGGEFQGIPILAEGEVYGPSWGHGYGAAE